MKRPFTALFAIAVASFGCSGDTSGPDRSDDELVFARLSASSQVPTAPASFWAVKGREYEFRLRLAPAQNQAEGDEFLEFRVRANSLLLKPGGQPFLNGDSILITVQADPQQRFIFKFEPSGLVFSPTEPAELRIRYDRVDDDIDHDGDRDAEDVRLRALLKVWQQQAPGAPWLPVPTLRIEDASEVRGTITHFTSFALAT